MVSWQCFCSTKIEQIYSLILSHHNKMNINSGVWKFWTWFNYYELLIGKYNFGCSVQWKQKQGPWDQEILFLYQVFYYMRSQYAVGVKCHTPWSRVRSHGGWFTHSQFHSQFHSRRYSLRISLIQSSHKSEIYNIGVHAQWLLVNQHRWQRTASNSV